MIATFHLGLAILVGAAAIVVAALAAGRAAGRSVSRRWVDRALIAALACLAIAILSGLAVLAGGRGPGDPLHYLYAFAAPLVLVVARWWTHPLEGRRLWVLAGAGFVAVVLVVRLAQTGG